jgi:hypothetical protein
MGGVRFVLLAPTSILWRSKFQSAVQMSLVSSNNRAGTVSISDQELAGTLAHK